MLGQLIKWLPSPVTVWNGQDDVSWSTFDVSASVDEDTVAVILFVQSPHDLVLNAYWYTKAFVRTNASSFNLGHAYMLSDNSYNRSPNVSSIWILPLTSDKKFDFYANYYAYGGSGGTSTVKILGEIKHGMPLAAGFDLIPLNATDGVLINGGTDSSWATVSPSVIPDDAIGILGSAAVAMKASSVTFSSTLYTRGDATFRPGGLVSTNQMSNTTWSIYTYNSFFQPVLNGSFQYYRYASGAYATCGAWLFGSYVMVPRRKGQAGYRFGNARAADLVVNLTAGPYPSWQKATVSNGKPGDLVSIYSVTGTGATPSRYGDTIGTQIRECLTPDHQPFKCELYDKAWLNAGKACRSVAWVRLDENLQFEWKSTGVTVDNYLYAGEIIPRVKL